MLNGVALLIDRARVWMTEALTTHRSRLVWLALAFVGALLLVRAFQPSPVRVDTATVETGYLRVTVDDDGQTRVRERYTISAPIQGRLLRTPLDPGDPVRAGQTIVAEFAPRDPDLLDARSRAEAVARVARAEAALGEAEARKKQADADLQFAITELGRTEKLHERGARTRDALDEVERNAQRARQAVRAAEFAIQVARFEQEVARASLREATPAAERGPAPKPPAGTDPEDLESGADGRLELRSPTDGTVLRVFEQSARTLAAGTPILEIGNTAALEIVADYLSQDAVQIRAGMPAIIRGFTTRDAAAGDGSEPVLRAEVRRVEPAGFTKVSALGVEEQRVNVILDPVGEPGDWASLGDGYRVEVSVILWEADSVLRVPAGALFRQDDRWAAFAIESDTARLRPLELGRRNGLEAQVTAGLAAGDRVVLYPSSELISDGTPISPR